MTTVATYGVRALFAVAVLASSCGFDSAPASTDNEAAPPGEQLTGPSGELLGVPRCGTERWPIKIGTDPAAGHVTTSNPKPNTITALAALPASGTLPPNARIEPDEDQVWTVTVTISKVKLEADRDYHLVLAEPSGQTMIAEIPDPRCVPTNDPWYPAISAARRQLDRYHPSNTAWTRVNRKAVVTGVEFFDNPHHQTGAAPNNVELHPALNIAWQ
jgi:hypothetical protein